MVISSLNYLIFSFLLACKNTISEYNFKSEVLDILQIFIKLNQHNNRKENPNI